MDKKITRTYLMITVLGILCTAFSTLVFQAYTYSRESSSSTNQEAVSWTDRMQMKVQNGTYLFSTTLPQEGTDGMVIAYDTSHMILQVTIDDEIVYTLKTGADKWMKTTGYQWNFIPLMKGDGGKKILFRVRPAYQDAKPKGGFYYGTRSQVEHTIIKERLPKFFITCLILISSIILLLYTVVITDKRDEDSGLGHFIVFAIMLGIWMICESQILELYIPCGIAMVMMDHLMLMLMSLPFLLFLRSMYPNRENPLWKFCCYLNCFVVTFRILLQLLGLYDLRETLWLTHIVLCVFVASIFALSISGITKKEMTKQMKLNICCVLILLAAVFVELLEYRLHNKSAPIGSIGFLFYIVVMGLSSVKKSHKMLEQAKESELYRKLAFVDELTGVYNRTAFKRDLNSCLVTDEKTQEQKILPTVLYMFDLNDLKKCNDNFGHEYGDQYIQMISSGIRKIFESDGNCYRIGGDEFCVITPFTSKTAISERLKCLNAYVAEKRQLDFVVPISVAAGYAVYDPEIDATLEDTMRRADDMMYQDKQAQKRAKSFP